MLSGCQCSFVPGCGRHQQRLVLATFDPSLNDTDQLTATKPSLTHSQPLPYSCPSRLGGISFLFLTLLRVPNFPPFFSFSTSTIVGPQLLTLVRLADDSISASLVDSGLPRTLRYHLGDIADQLSNSVHPLCCHLLDDSIYPSCLVFPPQDYLQLYDTPCYFPVAAHTPASESVLSRSSPTSPNPVRPRHLSYAGLSPVI